MKVEKVKTINHSNYLLSFYDGFDKDIIDNKKWVTAYLPQWSNVSASKPYYEFKDNLLVLKIDPNQKPWCPEFDSSVRVSSLQTGVFSGAVGTGIGQHHFRKDLIVREQQEKQQLFTPHLGYIEMRAKCNISKSNLAALWMIGFEEKVEESAERCIFELHGKNIKEGSSKIGYGVHPFGDTRIIDEFYEEEIKLDVREFNTYAIEWIEDSVKFYMNENLIRIINQSPNYPMQLMLNLYEFEGINSGKMEYFIDYIAGYGKQHS